MIKIKKNGLINKHHQPWYNNKQLIWLYIRLKIIIFLSWNDEWHLSKIQNVLKIFKYS